jgi:hypothetical protein
MMSPERVPREVLLAKRTPGDAGIVLPADNSLLDSFSLVTLPGNGE